MEGLWRWTSSVFLVLALNIGNTLTRNLGANCLLPPQILPGKPLCDCDPQIVNPQLQINNNILCPPNSLAPGGSTGPFLESQRQPFQDRLCTKCPLNQQACQCNEQANIVPISQSPFTNVGPLNAQSPLCANHEPVFNMPRQLMPFPQPQDFCSVGPPITPGLPQQNVELSDLKMLPPQGSLLPFAQRLLPSPCSTLTGPAITTLTPCPDPENNICSEPQRLSVCPQIDSAAFNKFRLPRPYIFQQILPSQSLLASYLPCDFNANTATQGSACANPALIQQDAICPQVSTAPATFIPNILPESPNQNCQQFPLQSFPVSQSLLNSGSCSLTPDVTSVNFLPLPTLPQSCAIPTNGFGTVLPQVTNFVDYPTTLLNLSPTYFEGTLPTSINGPSISEVSSLCKSAVVDTDPMPINLQINVSPPIIPPPIVTIINAASEPDATVPTNTEGSIDFPYPMPPMIIEGRRSRSRSWLPLVLVALFARDGDFGGCGGVCSCDSGPIPIPYPIAIPTNNPVIVRN